jgi:hypothetical protein
LFGAIIDVYSERKKTNFVGKVGIYVRITADDTYFIAAVKWINMQDLLLLTASYGESVVGGGVCMMSSRKVIMLHGTN